MAINVSCKHIEGEELKKCIRCGKEKPLSEFQGIYKYRVTVNCKDCLEEKTKEKRKEEIRQKSPVQVSYKYLEK